jgi:hypothetical protein
MDRKWRGAKFKSKIVAQSMKVNWWRSKFRMAAFAVVATSGMVLATIYKDTLTSLITPNLSYGFAWIQDHLFPMPDDKLIGAELRFYIPNNVNKGRSFEAVSVTFWPERCKRPEGASIVRTFDDGERDSYTNAIVTISCRASGRTLVTLTPQSGTTVTIYDGIFRDGEKKPFAGIPGSYYAGLLTLHLLDTKMPSGPWRLVNKCQLSNTCAEELGTSFRDQEQHQSASNVSVKLPNDPQRE